MNKDFLQICKLSPTEERVLKSFFQKHEQSLTNSAIQQFLSKSNNLSLLIKVLTCPTTENEGKLESKFREFLIELRLVKYISQIIHYQNLNLTKSLQTYKNRFPLYLDQEITIGEEIKIVDTIPSGEEFIIKESINFEEEINNNELFKTIQLLSVQQRDILRLYYLEGYNDREIGERYHVTQQSIAKGRKKSIEKIRQYLEKSDFKWKV